MLESVELAPGHIIVTMETQAERHMVRLLTSNVFVVQQYLTSECLHSQSAAQG